MEEEWNENCLLIVIIVDVACHNLETSMSLKSMKWKHIVLDGLRYILYNIAYI